MLIEMSQLLCNTLSFQWLVHINIFLCYSSIPLQTVTLHLEALKKIEPQIISPFQYSEVTSYFVDFLITFVISYFWAFSLKLLLFLF